MSKNDLAPVISESISEGTLRPTTSNDTGRYEKTGLVDPDNMQISPGLFIRSRVPEPAYLPLHWSAHIHPEGQPYFCRDGAPRVVTEAYLYRPETLDKVTRWIEKIEQIVTEKSFPISEQVELFIKIEDEDCAYYFVDHATRAQSWLEEIDTYDLGLPPVVSLSQLSIACEELYWTHVEHFPMHFGGLSRETLDSLVCVFTHAICDQMTSRVSTFPYSKQECEAFVSLLKSSRDHVADGNITCTVARLWSLVCRNRYLTHYGQEHSRLSRDQAILYSPETKHTWVSTVASRLSFKTSDRYLAQLDDVFVDHLVYTDQWKSLVTGCLRDWRGASNGAFLGLMLHIFLLALTSSPTLAVASALLFGASLLGATLLIHRYEPMEGTCATQAMEYLESIQSPTFKFQVVALMFALPHALRLWGVLVFSANCIFMLDKYCGTGFAVGITVAVFLAVLLFQWTTSESFNLSIAKLQAKFSRTQDDSYTSLV
ncbi:hypothetical protein DFH07DRAFT_56083 [Mycena maculata]|uniref:Uncharacterized protein n=1 Tax=Mycena maculata TaxID=230809 RepID=A0AAD7N194_9AGAR|nr:hypothetical protein DFH07DRAFT_56083 [Mycena maculata]